MLLRKFYAFLLTSICLIPIVTITLSFTSTISFTILLLMVALYVIGCLISYGIPSSVLSDVLTYKLKPKNRKKSALIWHLIFGFSFIFTLGLLADPSKLMQEFNHYIADMYGLLIASVLAALMIWFFDERIREKRSNH
ncbi:hypothetical protein ACKXGF_01920 [Alkalibacillus sp. S2W]|uniref:hypothetical protein n=1 Tax=Alkalibacillus sp. S2W TaxID=3386553 RepID=UPI00398D0DB7